MNVLSFNEFINEDRLEQGLSYNEKSTKKGGPITNLTAVEIRDEKVVAEAELERLDILDKVVTEYQELKTINENAKKLLDVKEVEVREAITQVINESDKYLTVGIETYNVTLTLSKYTEPETVKKPNYEKAIEKLRESAELLGVAREDLQAIIDLVIEDTKDTSMSGGSKPAIKNINIKNQEFAYRTGVEGRDAVETSEPIMAERPAMVEGLNNRKFKKLNENFLSKIKFMVRDFINSLSKKFINIQENLREVNKLTVTLGEPLI